MLMPGGGNGDDEMLQRQRQRMLRVGLMVILMFFMMDVRNSSNAAANKSSTRPARGGGSIPPSRQDTKKLEIVQEVLGGHLGEDDVVYPLNATGIYTGSWSVIDNVKSVVQKTFNENGGSGGAATGSVITPNASVSLGGEGSILMHMTQLPLEGTNNEVSLLWGVVHMYQNGADIRSKRNDLLYNVQGAYMHSHGTISAVVSRATNQPSVKLVWNNPAATNETVQEGGPHTRGLGAEMKLRVDEAGGKRTMIPLGGAAVAATRVSESEYIAHVARRHLGTASQKGNSTSASSSSGTESEPDLFTNVFAWPNNAKVGQDQSWVGISPRGLPVNFAKSSPNGKDCVFVMTLKTVMEAEEGKAPLTAAPAWVEALSGRLEGLNCDQTLKVSATAIMTTSRLPWAEFYPKAVNYSVVVTLVCIAQIGLLVKQLAYSSTQAQMARVSLYSIGMQAMIDALLCIVHIFMCASTQQLMVVFGTIAFVKLILFCVFEMRYIIMIYQAQQPQSFFEGGWVRMRRELAALHCRFYSVLFLVLLSAWMFRGGPRLLVFASLYGFWIPQIVKNVKRETRGAFHRNYLIGMSANRLLVPLYFFGCPHSFIKLVNPSYETRPWFCFGLMAWVGAQALVLMAQDRFGPLFFVPKMFRPPRYNYYRALPVAESGTADVEQGNLHECAICYQRVEEEGAVVTPCLHVFHSACLSRWMDIKLECPTCRATLPPI